MTGKMKTWFNKPLSLRVFYGMVFFAVGCFMLISLICHVYDNDMFFMLASGREIAENGIPKWNIWAAEPGMEIVVQQWLYDVLLYRFEALGNVGFSLFLLLQVLVFAYLCIRILRLYRLKWGVCFLILFCLFLVFPSYIFSIRPELVTTVLLLSDCLALERFGKDGGVRHLAVIPASIVLEMNLHMSMWPFHFCILLAYLVPVPGLPAVHNRVSSAAAKKPFTVLFLIAMMIVSLFLNPYGVDGILYVLRSMSSNTFNYVSIVEMQPMPLFSSSGIMFLPVIVLSVFLYSLKKAWGPGLNMAVGFGLLSMAAVRNVSFLVFPMLFLLRDLGVLLRGSSIKLDWKKDVRNYLIPILFAVDMLFLAGFLSSCEDVFLKAEDGTVSYMDRAVSYVKENWDGDGSIFVGFGYGGYFEYHGIDKVYLDARPEIFMKELNKKKSVLAEYAVYCEYGDILRTANQEEEERAFYVTREQMEDWMGQYDFRYVCVAPGIEANLYGYMLNHPDYEYVDEASSPMLAVYQKRG